MYLSLYIVDFFFAEHFHLRPECFFFVSRCFPSLNNVLARASPYRYARWLCAVGFVFCRFHCSAANRTHNNNNNHTFHVCSLHYRIMHLVLLLLSLSTSHIRRKHAASVCGSPFRLCFERARDISSKLQCNSRISWVHLKCSLVRRDYCHGLLSCVATGKEPVRHTSEHHIAIATLNDTERMNRDAFVTFCFYESKFVFWLHIWTPHSWIQIQFGDKRACATMSIPNGWES